MLSALSYRDVVVQDVIFQVHNTKFRLERYSSPSTKESIDAELPKGYRGSEIGPGLRALMYRVKPTPEEKELIEKELDQLFTQKTPMNLLNEQLKATHAKKKGLLTVLGHPHVPLHNNEAETDVRERVLKRQISYGNRSWEGVRAWDQQMGLVYTRLRLYSWSFDGHGTWIALFPAPSTSP